MTSAYEVGRIPEITLAHRLRIARETAGLDQGQLAELMGVSRNSVGNAESGKHTPRKILINAWALATGVPAYWLETGNPHPGGPDGGIFTMRARRDSNSQPSDP
ncbi:helix-turn-helix transcriptional regulator [Nocardia nova]